MARREQPREHDAALPYHRAGAVAARRGRGRRQRAALARIAAVVVAAAPLLKRERDAIHLERHLVLLENQRARAVEVVANVVGARRVQRERLAELLDRVGKFTSVQAGARERHASCRPARIDAHRVGGGRHRAGGVAGLEEALRTLLVQRRVVWRLRRRFLEELSGVCKVTRLGGCESIVRAAWDRRHHPASSSGARAWAATCECEV